MAEPFKTRLGAASTVRHGTTSGYYQHQAEKSPTCAACDQAKSKYDKERLSAPEKALRNRMYARAQANAMKRLRHNHLEEYAVLYAEAKEELGL